MTTLILHATIGVQIKKLDQFISRSSAVALELESTAVHTTMIHTVGTVCVRRAEGASDGAVKGAGARDKRAVCVDSGCGRVTHTAHSSDGHERSARR